MCIRDSPREGERRFAGVIEELHVDGRRPIAVVLVHELAVGSLLGAQEGGQPRHEERVAPVSYTHLFAARDPLGWKVSAP